MNKIPKVTIGIPTYNRASSLRVAIEQVLAQTFKHYELIICNDGSTDDTIVVVNSFNDSRIICSGMGLFDTTACLVNDTREWYIYNDTSDWKLINEDDLRLVGGDCKDWSSYYKKKFLQLGYESDYVTYWQEDFGHRLLIAYDETGYCVIDQIKSVCGEVRL